MHPAIISQIVGSTTNRLPDRMRHAAILRAFHSQPEYTEIRDAILAGRSSWLNWLTMTQRKWQTHTRRPARARHHDSVSIREKYVRVQE